MYVMKTLTSCNEHIVNPWSQMQQEVTSIKNYSHVTYWAWNRVRIKLLLWWAWELCWATRESTRIGQLRCCHLRTIVCCRVTNDSSFEVFKFHYQCLPSTSVMQLILTQLSATSTSPLFPATKRNGFLGCLALVCILKSKNTTRCDNFGSKVFTFMSSRTVSRDYHSYSCQAITSVRTSPLTSVNANWYH